MLEYPLLTLLVIAPFAEKVQQAERQRQAASQLDGLHLKLLVKSAELAKQRLDIKMQSSKHTGLLTPHVAVKRLRIEYQLAKLHVSRAKSEMTQVEFAERQICLTIELATIAKSEYDEAISINEEVPSAIPVPEVNRLRLEWEIASLRAQLAKIERGTDDPSPTPSSPRNKGLTP